MMPTNEQIILALVLSFICFITDLKSAKIYNKVTFPAIIIGLVLSSSLFGISGLLSSFYGLLTGILLYLPLSAIGAVGMGDTKLLGAIGSIGGAYYTAKIFLISSAIGFFHAMLVQYLNYGLKGFKLLAISYKEKIFLKKSINNENKSKSNKYKFIIGIDIFIASVILAYLYIFANYSRY